MITFHKGLFTSEALMKLTTKQVRSLVVSEVAKFKKPVDVEDVEAEEVDACDLADSLENHVDHTVKESVSKKIALVEALQAVESDLLSRVRKIRSTRQTLERTLLGNK